MSTQWYYAINGERGGPISAGELKALADQGRLRPDDLIWKEGMSEWRPARVAKGLFPARPASPSSPSPPPASSGPAPSGLWDDLDSAPKAQGSHSASNELFEPVAEPTHRAYQAPKAPVSERGLSGSGRFSREELRKIASSQRMVIFAFLIFFIGTIVFQGIATVFESIQQPAEGLSLIVLLVSIVWIISVLVLSILTLISWFRLCFAMYEIPSSLLMFFGLFVPCLSLIILILLVTKANSILKDHGIKVGFLGADMSRLR